jgi:tRNA A37 threonylcarbamoyladenosine dehydratase
MISYTVSHRLIHKQKISSEFTKINYNPHTKSLDKRQLIREVSEHDCSDQVKVKVKLKQSHNRPGVDQRASGGLGFQIPWQVGGEDVSLTHRPPLSAGNVPGIHFH